MNRFPIIVVDGPDGTGKTTLCNQIVDKWGAQYLHLTYRFKDKMSFYHMAALRLALRWSQYKPVIIDRWWMSELVYAQAFRGGTKWPWLGTALDSLAKLHDIHYVITLPEDRDEYLSHFDNLKNEREEMYDSMANVYDAYVNCHDLFFASAPRDDYHIYDLFAQGSELERVTDEIMTSAYDRVGQNEEYLNAARNLSLA